MLRYEVDYMRVRGVYVRVGILYSFILINYDIFYVWVIE